MRQSHLGEGAKLLEAQYHPEDVEVDAAGIWDEGHANYPGRSLHLPSATGIVRCWDEWGEVSRRHISRPGQSMKG